MPKHAARRRPTREPLIPDKLYFRIGEVAKLCGVETYVLRFWETEFPQMRPNKSGTGQRLYRKRDVEFALRVKRLLHDEGYTIAGARQVLTQEAAKARTPQLPLIEGGASAAPVKARLQRVRAELRDLLSLLSARPGHSLALRSESKNKPRPASPNLFE
ncbi:MAG TPA: MerR family transcriptional regulator [Acidobacteriaceae bacterium]|jgi:DNA-binding transcriptional MerR regulator|nr:MerR family transcriptional regulator [Acidobacteriaceae bacterium]